MSVRLIVALLPTFVLSRAVLRPATRFKHQGFGEENLLATSEYTQRYFQEVQQIAAGVDPARVDRMVELLAETREKRVGGSFLSA